MLFVCTSLTANGSSERIAESVTHCVNAHASKWANSDESNIWKQPNCIASDYCATKATAKNFGDDDRFSNSSIINALQPAVGNVVNHLPAWLCLVCTAASATSSADWRSCRGRVRNHDVCRTAAHCHCDWMVINAHTSKDSSATGPTAKHSSIGWDSWYVCIHLLGCTNQTQSDCELMTRL